MQNTNKQATHTGGDARETVPMGGGGDSNGEVKGVDGGNGADVEAIPVHDSLNGDGHSDGADEEADLADGGNGGDEGDSDKESSPADGGDADGGDKKATPEAAPAGDGDGDDGDEKATPEAAPAGDGDGDEKSFFQYTSIKLLTKYLCAWLRAEADACTTHAHVDWEHLCRAHYHWFVQYTLYEARLLQAYRQAYLWNAELRDKREVLEDLEKNSPIIEEDTISAVCTNDMDPFTLLRQHNKNDTHLKRMKQVRHRIEELEAGLRQYEVEDRANDMRGDVFEAWSYLFRKHALPRGSLFISSYTLETLRWLRGHKLVSHELGALRSQSTLVSLFSPMRVAAVVLGSACAGAVLPQQRALGKGIGACMCTSSCVYHVICGYFLKHVRKRKHEWEVTETTEAVTLRRRHVYLQHGVYWTDERFLCAFLVGTAVYCHETDAWMVLFVAILHLMAHMAVQRVAPIALRRLKAATPQKVRVDCRTSGDGARKQKMT